MRPQLLEPSGLLVYDFLTIQLIMTVGLLYCIVQTLWEVVILFGGYYGHLGLNVRFESMEHYGKCNDSLNAAPQVQKTLSKGDLLGEVVRHTLTRRFTD